MPIPYTWTCTATIKANTPAYSEILATCIEDPAQGAQSIIQRVYPIDINTVLVPSAPSIDYVVRIKKEGVDGVIRPLADSIPASLINKLMAVSGQLPSVFYQDGEPATIYIAPMEKIYIYIVNLSAGGTSDTTVSFQVVAEKG
jgi:hypothetical protein